MEALRNFYKGKKILITGHTGFKGSWLALWLHDMGASVIGVSNSILTSPSCFEAFDLKNKLKHNMLDVRSFEKLNELMLSEKPDIVFHLAAQTIVRESYVDPLYTYSTNVIGTANILQSIQGCDTVKSCVVVTSDKVYQNTDTLTMYTETDRLGGNDHYSASKACAELVTHAFIRTTLGNNPDQSESPFIATARAGNVIGGGDWSKDRLLPDIVRALYEGSGEITIRFPEAVRPWQHVIEPVYGYLLLGKRLYEQDASVIGGWNFGPAIQEAISVEEIVNKLLVLTGKGSVSIQQGEEVKREDMYLHIDSKKANSALGWNPALDIDQSLNHIVSWYDSFYKEEDIVAHSLHFIRSYERLIDKQESVQ